MTWNSQAAGGAGPPLPSLHALSTFDAVARHSSMTRAAAELGVTQTAVSHQIKRLEDELGYALFRRVGNRSQVTTEGAAWAEQLGPLFARLRSVNQQLRTARPMSRETLCVSVIPSFGTRFLLPRLSGFAERHPDVNLRIAATERMVDLELEKVDVAIRYGRGKYPGFHVAPLAPDAFVPLCTPRYLDLKRLTKWQALKHVDLLHDDYPDAWARWFDHAGAPAPAPRRTLEYTESSMLVEAALLGQGVALCRQSLVTNELRTRRLTRLFESIPPMPCELGYYTLVSDQSLERPLVGVFTTWLKKQVVAAGLV